MANGSPQSAQAILDGIARLPPQSRDATLADKDISSAILGMAKSGDPTKAEAANSLMDQVQRQNPLTFEDKFGKPAVAELSDWNARRQFLSPDQLLEEAKKAKDPAALAAQNVWKAQADENLKTVTPASIVKDMGSAGAPNRWNPFHADWTPISDAPAAALGTLKNDYDAAYRYQFGRTGDQNAAEAFAKETLGKKYTFSPSNGDRLTAWAPETSDAYKQVNRSKDYIGTQLADFMAAQGHPGAKAYLVPDTQTDAEIHTDGAAPSYRVVAQGNDGQFHALPTTARFSADPRAAQGRANEDFMTANRPSEQGAPTWEIGRYLRELAAKVTPAPTESSQGTWGTQ